MNLNIKKYFALTRASIITSLSFRLSTLIMIFGNLLYLLVVYFLWKAIYASAGTDTVNGMTFNDTLIYLVLATALFTFMEMYIVWEIGRNIQSGQIVLDLIKPMDYRQYVFWSYAGELITHFVFTFLPTFIVVSIVTHGAIPMSWNLLWFILSVFLAVSINNSIDYFVGGICLYTESIWGINIMKQVLVTLLSGATIPIAIFPEPFKTVVMYLPFQSIYNTPLLILLGKSGDTMETLSMIGVQAFWVVVMALISRGFWRLSIRQITVNGGSYYGKCSDS